MSQERSALGQLVGGQAVAVTPVAIEEELARLWRQAAEEAEREEQAPTRVRVLNLVAVAFDGPTEGRIDEALTALPDRHPSRSIVVRVSAEAPPGELRASIGARCRLGEGGQQVCSEEVTLRGHPEDGRALASAVASLLVADLPVFLWWPGAPLAGYLFEELRELSDRLILDTTVLPPDAATLSAVDDVARDSPPLVSDLSWARLLPWRDLSAQLFDSPSYRPCLDTLSQVEIESTGVSTQPLLLLGWLASRLEWSPVDGRAEGDGFRFVFASGVRGVEASLRMGGDRSSALSAVRLSSRRPPALFEITLPADSECATIRVELEGREAERRSTPLAPPPEGELLCRELDQLGREPAFEDALAAARALARLAEGA